jgi:hypothetical protein
VAASPLRNPKLIWANADVEISIRDAIASIIEFFVFMIFNF